ncbi:MAG: NAD(P)/FAD-dependent oxidoreductase, partial [Thermoplasmata archaeon]
MYDVAVVGAGPAGCRVAEIVASAGYDVLIIEEHSAVGHPVQCAGLVSPRIRLLVKKCVLSSHNRAIINLGEKTLEISGKGEKAVVIDRAGLDKELCSRALDAGADIMLRAKVVALHRAEYWRLKIAGGDAEGVRARVVVGADGPYSMVRRSLGLPSPTEYLSAYQVVYHVPEREQVDDVRLIVDKNLTDFFMWAIPYNDEVRVGVAVGSRCTYGAY